MTLPALTAAVSMRRLEAVTDADRAPGGAAGLLMLGPAGAVFLGVQTPLFHGSAYRNAAEDEVWLRCTLRSPGFYLTQPGTLTVGALSAAVWIPQTRLVRLMIPIYGPARRAALHGPLLERANTDARTALRFEARRRLAVLERDRCTAEGAPWSIVFADLPAAAVEVAERVRASVAELRLPRSGSGITISLGVAGTGSGGGTSSSPTPCCGPTGRCSGPRAAAATRCRGTGRFSNSNPFPRPASPARPPPGGRLRLSAADDTDLARPDR